jgi:hypothetical protein
MKAGQDYTLIGTARASLPALCRKPGYTLLARYRIGTTTTGSRQLHPYAEVLCAGTGSSTNSISLTSLGACIIPAQYLAVGDRVEMRFDVDHTVSTGSFSVELHWGGATVLDRDAAFLDTQAAFRADTGMRSSSSQFGQQSWGTVRPFAGGVGSAAGDFSAGITIDFQAKVANASDMVALRNYTVVRFP